MFKRLVQNEAALDWAFLRWQVASGKWKVESGKWKVGSGKWEVGSGKWEIRHGKTRKARKMVAGGR
jgi:hypothetical protein